MFTRPSPSRTVDADESGCVRARRAAASVDRVQAMGQKAESFRDVDSVVARRDAKLSVDRRDVALDRVTRDGQAFTDASERQMRR